jgi:hypothetical protein
MDEGRPTPEYQPPPHPNIHHGELYTRIFESR